MEFLFFRSQPRLSGLSLEINPGTSEAKGSQEDRNSKNHNKVQTLSTSADSTAAKVNRIFAMFHNCWILAAAGEILDGEHLGNCLIDICKSD
jgi:hypothetical protein